MSKRVIWTSIDNLVGILRDYLGPGVIPVNARPLKLQVHPTERVFAVVIDSPDIPEGALPLRATFDIKRYFSLRGNAGE